MPKLSHCGAFFRAYKRTLLFSDLKHRLDGVDCRYQDFYQGHCPECHEDVYGWIGFDEHFNAIGAMRGVSSENHQKWINRIIFDAVGRGLKETDSKIEVHWVWGSAPKPPYNKRKVLVK